MWEVANTSYEDSLQNESINSQNEELNNEGLSSKSIDDYINEQKSLLLEITDKNLQEHAQEEFQEVQEKFEALRWDTTDIAALQLADLHQEFQRDISGLNKLEDTQIASMISLEELNLYLSTQTEEFQESFYSIMNNTSENQFQAQILEFNEMYGEEWRTDIDDSVLWDFITEFSDLNNHAIEQQEITELINLDVNSITSTDQVEYYKQQIQHISSYTQPEEEQKLNEVIDKLNQIVIFEVSEEKTGISEEKTKVSEEKVRASVDFKNNYSDLYEDIQNSWKIDELNNEYKDIINILKDIHNTSDDNQEKLDLLKSDLLGLLIVNNVAEQFLLDLWKIDQKLYSKTLDLFNRTSDDLRQKLSHLPTIYSEPKVWPDLVDGFTSSVEATMWEGSIVIWDKVTSKDGKKYMDLWVEPPQAYIRSENGFRLNTTVEFPNIITLKENEFKQESAQLEWLISEWKEDYNLKLDRKQQLERVKAQLGSNEISTEEKNRLQEQYPNLDTEISELSLEMDMLDTKIKENEKKLADMTAEFQREHKQAIDWYKAQVEAKDKKTQEVLKFLEGVWFNLIPQSITNSIIEQLNNPWNSSLRGLIGFNTLLNLSEWDLWFQTSFNDHTLWTTEKVIFAEFINRMISTNPWEPIDVTKILNGWSVPVEDRTKLSFQLEQAGLKDSWTAIWIAMDNLRKSTLEK